MRTRTRADSQFDVTVEVDIKLPKPYRKDLPKTLNRLGIREKPFYRAGDVAQLLGTVALVLWRFRTGEIQAATANRLVWPTYLHAGRPSKHSEPDSQPSTLPL